jgi:hypothetical protein
MPHIDHFTIGNDVALPELYVLSKSSLCDLSRILAIDLAMPSPSALARRTGGADGNTPISQQDLVHLLEGGNLAVNCYAIYTRRSGENWRMRYVGETTIQQAAIDLSAWLLPNAARPSLIHAQCDAAVQAGCLLGLRLIHVEPETLRHFIQEKILAEMQSGDTLDWHECV